MERERHRLVGVTTAIQRLDRSARSSSLKWSTSLSAYAESEERTNERTKGRDDVKIRKNERTNERNETKERIERKRTRRIERKRKKERGREAKRERERERGRQTDRQTESVDRKRTRWKAPLPDTGNPRQLELEVSLSR